MGVSLCHKVSAVAALTLIIFKVFSLVCPKETIYLCIHDNLGGLLGTYTKVNLYFTPSEWLCDKNCIKIIGSSST